MTTILLTGFGPFPGVVVNASAALVARVAISARRRWPEVVFHTATLPTEWARGPKRARMIIARTQPDIILHFGVSGRASGFVIETRSANQCVAEADGAGHLPPLALLETDGPKLRRVTLPVADIVARLKLAALPVSTSDDAGSYLCNAVLFQSLGLTEGTASCMAGFIHIPATLAADTLDLAKTDRALTVGQALTGSLDILAVCLEAAT
jgi:pyroglutamyl-peptidase